MSKSNSKETIALPPSHSPTIRDNIRNMRFGLMEFSGSLGDLGTFIPLTVAMVVVTGLDIGIILIFAGVFNIVTGLIFGQPIPVQPMKAIAAVAIAEHLLPGEIAASGLLVALVVLILGITNWIDKVDRIVPKAVIRGIQLGVGLKLAIKGIGYISPSALWGWDSISVAVTFGILSILLINSRQLPTAVIIFGYGLVAMFVTAPAIDSISVFSLPSINIVIPTGEQWLGGLLSGALPQLPLTLLNSVLAICALSGDLFPGRRIPTGRMAISVGMMNLISCPFGAMPMCHGSGGLAGQYHFGARTGGSVVLLGAGKLLIGLFFGAAAMSLLRFYPVSIMGILLLFAGIELAKPARDQNQPIGFMVMFITAIGIVAVNTAVGFLFGIAAFILVKLVSRTQS